MYTDPIAWSESLDDFRPVAPAWRAVIRAFYNQPLTPDELVVYRSVSRDVDPPSQPVSDLLAVAGRRSGKSLTTALCLVHEAINVEHGDYLEPGQLGVIGILAPERRQSEEILAYCKGLCERSEVKPFVAVDNDGPRILKDSIEFVTGIKIAIVTADSSSLRGTTFVGAALDEWAFAAHVGTDPDSEIVRALEGGLTPVQDAPRRRLFAISSAGYRQGWFYDVYAENYGNPDRPVLVVQGSTDQFNPNVDRDYLANRKKKDPAGYEREFNSAFGDATASAWIPQEIIDLCTDKKRDGSVAWRRDTKYHVAIDAAFKKDAFAVAVVCSYLGGDPDNRRRHSEVVHVDRWKPEKGKPLSTEEMVRRVWAVCNTYGTRTVYIDQHESTSLSEAFRRVNLKTKLIPWSGGNGPDSKYARYTRVRAEMVDGAVTLPNDPRLLGELGRLQATPKKDESADIRAGSGNDDMASAMVLALSEALSKTAAVRESDMTEWERQKAAKNLAWFQAATGFAGYIA